MVGWLALIGVLAAALARGRGVALTSVGEGRNVASSSICDSVFAPSGLGERRTAASIGRVLAPSKVMEGRTAAFSTEVPAGWCKRVGGVYCSFKLWRSLVSL